MGWVRLDDGFFHNRKTLEVSNNARLLYIACLCHCASQLTDGVISAAACKTTARILGIAPRVSKELVKVGLWDVHDDGFIVPDYLEYHPSAEVKRAERAATADRVKRWRNGKRNGVTNAVSNGVSNGPVTPSPYPYPISISSLSDLRPAIPGVVESEIERKKALALCERLAGVVPRAKPPDVVSCVWWALDGLDMNLVDELIGTCEQLNERPRSVRYVATMIRNRASQVGVQLDEWKGAA